MANPNDWPVQIEQPVYFRDMNLAAHVDNVRYVEWMDIVRSKLNERGDVTAAFDGDVSVFEDPMPVVAHFQISYRFPLVTTESVVLLSRVKEVRTTSFVQEHAVYLPSEGAMSAVGESRLVMFDPATGQKTPLADSQVEALKALMPTAS